MCVCVCACVRVYVCMCMWVYIWYNIYHQREISMMSQVQILDEDVWKLLWTNASEKGMNPSLLPELWIKGWSSLSRIDRETGLEGKNDLKSWVELFRESEAQWHIILLLSAHPKSVGLVLLNSFHHKKQDHQWRWKYKPLVMTQSLFE